MIPVGKPLLPPLEYMTRKVSEIINSSQVSNGKYVRLLEEKVQEIHKVKHAIAFANCTTGLILTVKNAFPVWEKWGVWKPVAIPNYTWKSTNMALRFNCIISEYVDVDPDTFLIDKIPEHVYGVLAVDTFGNRCDLKIDKPVIYDAAHSLGVPGVGNRGVAEVFSMSPMKTFTACEGGIVVTNDDTLAEKLREDRRFFGRMPEINAVIGLYNLNRLDEVRAEKKNTFNYYKRELEPLGFKFQKINESSYNEISVVHENAKGIIKEIQDKIEIRSRYEPFVRALACSRISEHLFDNSFILPSWIGVPKEEVVRIIKEA